MSRHDFRERSPICRSGSRGQATVEFALVLPVIVVLLGVIVQVGLITASHLDVVEETRRVARSASLAEDPRTAALAALPTGSTSRVDVWFDATSVTVVVTRRIDNDVPIIGRFTPTVAVQSRLTLAREPMPYR
jgi:Flp pilus assembly protein TadG